MKIKKLIIRYPDMLKCIQNLQEKDIQLKKNLHSNWEKRGRVSIGIYGTRDRSPVTTGLDSA